MRNLTFILWFVCFSTISLTGFSQSLKDKEKAQLLYYQAKTEYTDLKLDKALRKIDRAINLNNCAEYRDFRRKITNSNAGFASELNKTIHEANKHFKKHEFLKAQLLNEKALDIGKASFLSESYLMSCLYTNYGVSRIFNQSVTEPAVGTPYLRISRKDMTIAKEQFDSALANNPDNYIAKINSAYINYILKDTKNHKTGKIFKHPRFLKDVELNNQSSSPKFKNIPNRINLIIKSLDDYDEILLIADISGSMTAALPNFGASRIEVMKDALLYLLGDNGLPKKIKIGFLTIEDCIPAPMYSYSTLKNNRHEISRITSTLQPVANTPLNDRLNSSPSLFSQDQTKSKAILLLSDGVNTCGGQYTCAITKNLHENGIDIYVLTFLLANRNIKEFSMYDCIAESGNIWAIDDEKKVVYVENNIWPIYQFLIPPIIRPEGKHAFAIDLPCEPEMNTDNPYYIQMKE